MKNNLIIKVFALLSIVVCTGVSCSKKHKRPYGIIFCDFSTSIDSSESIRKIKKDAIDILADLGTTSNLEYYSISKNAYSACLFKNMPLERNPRPSVQIAYKQELERQVDSLKTLLNLASSTASAVDRKEPNSCIISCIERAITYFRNYEPEDNTELHLYILSDMLECCTFDKDKIINLEPGNNIEKQSGLINDVTDSTFSFREFKNLRIHIVLSTKKVADENRRWFTKFWEAVFRRYGYDISRSISVELPTMNSKDK